MPAKATWIDDVRRVIKREHGKGWRVEEQSWRSNFRELNPAVAQQAETLLGGPLSLALQAAMDAGENPLG